MLANTGSSRQSDFVRRVLCSAAAHIGDCGYSELSMKNVTRSCFSHPERLADFNGAVPKVVAAPLAALSVTLRFGRAGVATT